MQYLSFIEKYKYGSTSARASIKLFIYDRKSSCKYIRTNLQL